MKQLKTSALLAAVIGLAFTACDKKTADGGSGNSAKPLVVDEKTALANFKTDAENVGKWIAEKQKTAPADPAAGVAMMGEMVAKFKTIKTDGLPADLKSAWGEMTAVLAELGDVFKTMPKIDETKPEEAGKAMEEYMPKLMGVEAKMKTAANKLEEVGKNYGVEMRNIFQTNEFSESKDEFAKIYVQRLNGTLMMYTLTNLYPPSTAQGLQALVQMPQGDPHPRKWKQLEEKIEADPWGHEYRYESPGRHNKNSFDIYSCGPDGKPGTADDIGNW